jgi:hypothetical protein
MATIKSKYSTTAGATPTTLAVGELAFNIADKKGWIGTSTTSVEQILGTGAGYVDSISFGSTGLTPSSATGGDVVVAGTVNVSHGGTGNTATPTAGGAVYGDGSKMATTAAGNSGQILTSQGSSAPIWANIGVGGFSNGVVFTTSGSFTVPSTGKFKVTVVGGGATGANENKAINRGGGAGATAIKWFTGLTPGNTGAVTIGATGSSGGSSTFVIGATTVTGGGASNATGGSASGGDINLDGGNGGTDSDGRTLAYSFGNMGASSTMGQGGAVQGNPGDGGINATGYGAGGGGSWGYVNSPGNGTQGIVVIEY